MTKVLCIGIATLDYVYAVDEIPADAQKKYRAYDLITVGGGTAASAANAIAKLGGEAVLATRLGGDAVGRDIIAELAAAGVDCTLARRFADCRSPCSAVFVDRAGERLVTCYADESTPDDASWLPDRLPDRTGAVLADVSWVTGAIRMLAAARAAGIPSVIDGDRLVADPTYFDQASHVAYSTETVCELAGIGDPRKALEKLARRAPNWIAVTDGPRGVWFTDAGAIAHEPAFQVEVVDTLGAGDVFHGALALALGEGMGERAAVRFANAAAALKCSRFGGGRLGAPSRAEVEALLREGA